MLVLADHKSVSTVRNIHMNGNLSTYENTCMHICFYLGKCFTFECSVWLWNAEFVWVDCPVKRGRGFFDSYSTFVLWSVGVSGSFEFRRQSRRSDIRPNFIFQWYGGKRCSGVGDDFEFEQTRQIFRTYQRGYQNIGVERQRGHRFEIETEKINEFSFLLADWLFYYYFISYLSTPLSVLWFV